MKDNNVKSIKDYKISKLTEEDRKTRQEILDELGIDIYENSGVKKSHGLIIDNEYKVGDMLNHKLVGFKVLEETVTLSFIDDEYSRNELEIFIDGDKKINMKLNGK
ncbi:hypothetical protein [Bacillus seohaeanensis]|uniref:Uncharacterized protein n=1 Tax=Bacillus seohaeanensis TaxID=284580 RepID=A0ABW5RLS7_9BACI